MQSWIARYGVAGFLAMASAAAAAAGPPESLAHRFPAGALAYVEVQQLGQVIDRVRQAKELALVAQYPQIEEWMRSPQYSRLEGLRQVVETQLGTDIVTIARSLLGSQVALGVYPSSKRGGKQPDVLVAARVEDPELVARLEQRVEGLLLLAGAKPDAAESVEGTRVRSLDDKAFVAIAGKAGASVSIALSSNRVLLLHALRGATGDAKSLSQDSAFADVSKRLGSGHLAMGYLNVRMLAESRAGFSSPKLDNPLVALLVGGLLELGVRSPAVGAWVDVRETELAAGVMVPGSPDSLSEAYRGFFSEVGPEAQSSLRPPGFLARLSLSRDLPALYRHREELLAERVLPKFEQFESNLGNLLPRRDFAADVLPLFGRQLTLVAAQQRFERLGSPPGIQLPAFALVAQLADPEKGEDLFQLLFQTIVTVLNFQVKERGGEPMVLAFEQAPIPLAPSRPPLAASPPAILYAKYLGTPTQVPLPVIFNFAPACARVGDQFIFSSSLELCRDLVTALSKSGKSESASPNLDLLIDPRAVAGLLTANRQVIEARAIQDGKPPERAAQDFGTLVQWLGKVQSVRLATLQDSQDVRIELKAGWHQEGEQ